MFGGRSLSPKLNLLEIEDSKNILIFLRVCCKCEPGNEARRIITLGQESKKKGIIWVRKCGVAEEYNHMMQENRLVCGTEAWRHVSYKNEYLVDEVEWNAVHECERE